MLKAQIHNILFGGLLALLFCLPIPLGSNRPWAWSMMELVIFILLLASLVLYREQLWVRLKPYSTVLFLWLLFILWAMLQIVPLPAHIVGLLSPHSLLIQQANFADTLSVSLDRGQSEIAFIKSLAYFSLFVLTLLLVNSENKIRYLLLTILLTGTLQAVYGCVEILLGLEHSVIFSLPVSDAATGSFVYKNHFANFIMLCLSAGIGLIIISLTSEPITNRREWLRMLITTLLSPKALFRISLAIMVIGLVMSHSRMGNVAFFAAMTITGVLALLLFKTRNRGLIALIVSMLIIDTIIVSAWFGLDKVKQRLVETSLTQEGRDEVVIDALPMLSDFPLTGSGGGSFYGVFPAYQQAQVHGFYDQAHNDYLQTAIEYGLPGLLVMALIVALCYIRTLHTMKVRNHPLLKGAAFASSMAILGMSIHMTVDFPLQAPANACFLVVYLGLAQIAYTHKIARAQHRRESYGS